MKGGKMPRYQCTFHGCHENFYPNLHNQRSFSQLKLPMVDGMLPDNCVPAENNMSWEPHGDEKVSVWIISRFAPNSDCDLHKYSVVNLLKLPIDDGMFPVKGLSSEQTESEKCRKQNSKVSVCEMMSRVKLRSQLTQPQNTHLAQVANGQWDASCQLIASWILMSVQERKKRTNETENHILAVSVHYSPRGKLQLWLTQVHKLQLAQSADRRRDASCQLIWNWAHMNRETNVDGWDWEKCKGVSSRYLNLRQPRLWLTQVKKSQLAQVTNRRWDGSCQLILSWDEVAWKL